MSKSGDVEPTSANSSQSSKVKFLCSHGGRILPRPVDGHLKYVGGETRVISVPRNITFDDLMKKLSSLTEGDVTLKYQLIPEELDALVTVKSDEDLRHMFDEYDRQELKGTPRLRTFLFVTTPIVIESQVGPMDRYSLEQRYINSINGIVVNPRPMYNRSFKPLTVNTSHSSLTISSACSSPRTPPDIMVPMVGPDFINPEISSFRNFSTMPRARSSPNLSNLGASSSQINLHHLQPPLQPLYYHPQQFSKPPYKNSVSDHLMRARTAGLAEYYRHPTNYGQYTPNMSTSGHMVYPKGSPYDEYYGINRYDRESVPGSR